MIEVQANPAVLHLAPALDLDQLPVFATKEMLAEIGARYFFPVAPRTIREHWPLTWLEVNDRLVARVADFVGLAQQFLDGARVVVGPKQQQQHAA